ncbi:MAG: carbohydrate-binding domain-containing protein [Lachnospiraceae bacterium]|nr:carbohydrate-binding domain-containing protein [Lachnospiraceae bacterium]
MKRKIVAVFITAILVTTAFMTGCRSGATKQQETNNGYNDFRPGEPGENMPPEDIPGNNNSTESDAEGETVEKFDVTTKYNEDEKVEDFQVETVVNTDGTAKATDKNVITLKKTSIDVSGTGMKAEGSDVTISKPGTYYVSGILDDGQIIIDCEDDGTVYLVMNGATITCSDSAPVYCCQAELLVINLVKGTTTTLTDGSEYVYPDAETDEPNACLYCDDDMTINGEGNLVVNANYNNGIAAKDILKFYNGNVTVYAKNNGVKGKDGVVVSSGKLTVECNGDGIKADNTSDTTKGYVLIEGGYVTITSGEDGIQAETCLKITGGDTDILTGEGSEKVSTNNDWGMIFRGNSSSNESTSASMKGIKAGTDITITGGIVKIDSEDDSIHSNATIDISGGNITTAAGDDGIHSDTKLTISGGNINVTKSYEGLESSTIEITGGKTYVKASDDGINAAGGDGSATNGRPGMNSFSSSTGAVVISGGYTYLYADGDGLDSNGTIVMTGGQIDIDGPTSSGNGFLDYDGSFKMTGGVMNGSGSSGMLQYPSCSEKAYCVTIVFTSTQSAKTTVKITDKSGNVVAEYTPAKNFTAYEYAGENLKDGETYTVYLNDTEYDTFTVSGNNVSIGSAGGMGGMGQGGGMGPGGMRPGRR